MKFPLNRRHLALLALVPALALTGCGGDEGEKAGPRSPAPSAPGTGAPSSPGAQPGAPAEAPKPSASGDPRRAPANRFNDCVKRQGVKMPTPGQTRRPSESEIKKVQEALKTCVSSLSSPAATPKN